MIYKESSEINKIYHGTTPIWQLYKGDTLVYFRGVILRLERYIPAADVACPHPISNTYDGADTLAFNWKVPLPIGTYTFRFNTDGTSAPDVVTCNVDETRKLVLEWTEGLYRKTKIYISNTQLYLEYTYDYRMVSGSSTRYPNHANKYITTIELI